MSQRDQKNDEEKACQKQLSQSQDDEYEEYLFWPSLSNGNLSSHLSSPLYGPVSLHSESTDFDSSVRGSGPPSPITFAPILDHRFPLQLEEALDFGVAPLEEADAAAQPEVRKENPPQKYSPIVQMGLFLLQMTRGLDRAIEGVKLKFRKPKEPEL